MTEYYLDIETTGLSEDSTILTIQYVELDRSGAPIGNLRIIKEWETGERRVLEQFISETGVTSPRDFDFVAVGYNLRFEERMLRAATARHGLPGISVLSRPYIDLHQVGILLNGGRFRGSGLDDITGKRHDGSYIGGWYSLGQYHKIEDYIRNEADEFLRLYGWLLAEMPAVRRRWNESSA